MREGFQIGPLVIRYYALIILAGVMAAAWLSILEAKRRDKKTELVWDMLPWIVIGGIIGARLWHIFTPSESSILMGYTTKFYLTHPINILYVWEGGLGIPGAVIGGALALLLYTRKIKENFLEWGDIIVPGLALAQAIGRWGNFVNQELYGSPSTLPWAISIERRYRLPGYLDVEKYHPLFLYESLLNLLAMGVLLIIGRKYKDKLIKGDLFLLYLVFYPVIRFSLEFLRLDYSPVVFLGNKLNINQLTMAIVALVAIALIIYRHVKKAKNTEILVPDEETLPEAAEQTLEGTLQSELESLSAIADLEDFSAEDDSQELPAKDESED